MAPTEENRQAVFLDLADLTHLDVTIGNVALPDDIAEILRSVLLAIVRKKLKEQEKIPLSVDFDAAKRAGVRVHALRSRVRPPANGSPGTLTIGIDTTGNGNANAVEHLVPAGEDFALVTTREFLVEKVWPIYANGFSHRDGRVTVDNPQLDLRDGYIWLKVDAEYDVPCLPDVNATATGALVFEAVKSGEVWLSRVVLRDDPTITVDPGDRLFYSILLGVVLALIGVGGAVLNAVILNVIIDVLLGEFGETVGDDFEGFSVGFRKAIPGTNVVGSTSTETPPTVSPEGITAAGKVVFSEQTHE